jgi:hypothetical protein
MKKLTHVIAAALITLSLSLAQAAEKMIAGPQGGKLLEYEGQRAEFFVKKDRTVTITFYDHALKPVASAEQSVTVIAEAPGGKATLAFEKKGESLASKTPMPEGDGYNVVVQIKTSADAKPKNFRIAYKTHACPTCNLAEYACICDE